VNTSHDSSTDRIGRTAAWLYVAPRVAIGFLVLATIGLAVFLVLAQLALVILHRLGA